MPETLENAVRKFHKELFQIHEVKKCKTCTCFYEALQDLEKALNTINEDKMKGIRRDIIGWRKEGEELKLHECLGCDPCLPVAPSNEFYEAVSKPKPETRMPTRLRCELGSKGIWPPIPGTYYLGNASGVVAVCTLSSELDSFKELSRLDSVAIVGKLTTENLGIEKIIQNTISNLNIRYLILCGHDARGHYPGQAILSLAKKGIDARGMIVGAKGARPFLRNVTREQIEAFRLQIQVIDLIGNTDAKAIIDQIGACSEKHIGSFCSSETRIQELARIIADHDKAKEFVADPSGFFTILIEHKSEVIIVEHYSNDFRLQHIIKGKRAEDICATIIKLGFVSRLDHAAYLGRELQKAENALKLQLEYEQEKA